MILEFRDSIYSVIPWNSANPIPWCRLLGCRPKEKAVNQMIVQERFPTLPSSTAFTSQSTNLSAFIKGCREWDTSMWIYVCLWGVQPQSLWSSVWFARERLRNEFKTSGPVCAFTDPVYQKVVTRVSFEFLKIISLPRVYQMIIAWKGRALNQRVGKLMIIAVLVNSVGASPVGLKRL